MVSVACGTALLLDVVTLPMGAYGATKDQAAVARWLMWGVGISLLTSVVTSNE